MRKRFCEREKQNNTIRIISLKNVCCIVLAMDVSHGHGFLKKNVSLKAIIDSDPIYEVADKVNIRGSDEIMRELTWLQNRN